MREFLSNLPWTTLQQYSTVVYSTILWIRYMKRTVQCSAVQYSNFQVQRSSHFSTIQQIKYIKGTVQYTQYSTVQYITAVYSIIQQFSYIRGTVKSSTVQYSGLLNNQVDQVHELMKGTGQYRTIHLDTVQYNLVQYSGLLNNLVDQVHEGNSLGRHSTVHYSCPLNNFQWIRYMKVIVQYGTGQYSCPLNNLVNQVHEGNSLIRYSSVQLSTQLSSGSGT